MNRIGKIYKTVYELYLLGSIESFSGVFYVIHYDDSCNQYTILTKNGIVKFFIYEENFNHYVAEMQ